MMVKSVVKTRIFQSTYCNSKLDVLFLRLCASFYNRYALTTLHWACIDVIKKNVENLSKIHDLIENEAKVNQCQLCYCLIYCRFLAQSRVNLMFWCVQVMTLVSIDFYSYLWLKKHTKKQRNAWQKAKILIGLWTVWTGHPDGWQAWVQVLPVSLETCGL